MFGQKTAFWAAVAVVSVVAQFTLEAASNKFPSVGLARFTAFAHKGPA